MCAFQWTHQRVVAGVPSESQAPCPERKLDATAVQVDLLVVLVQYRVQTLRAQMKVCIEYTSQTGCDTGHKGPDARYSLNGTVSNGRATDFVVVTSAFLLALDMPRFMFMSILVIVS